MQETELGYCLPIDLIHNYWSDNCFTKEKYKI